MSVGSSRALGVFRAKHVGWECERASALRLGPAGTGAGREVAGRELTWVAAGENVGRDALSSAA